MNNEQLIIIMMAQKLRSIEQKANSQKPKANSKWNADPPASDAVKRIQQISAD